MEQCAGEKIMRKKLFTILLTTSIVISLLGCGSNEDNNADVPEQETTINVLTESDESQNEEIEEAPEVVPEEPVKFDCLDEIRNASPDSGMVQVDDMIIQFGSTFSDFLDVIGQSECTYIADYNESKLIIEGDGDEITFRKNDNSYFSMRFINTTTETIELKDCAVSIITIYEAAKGNVYYAGFNGDKMTYSSVKESMKDYEPEHEYSYNDPNHNQQIEVQYRVPASEILNIPTRISPNGELSIYFLFESDTGDLRAVLICGFDASMRVKHI